MHLDEEEMRQLLRRINVIFLKNSYITYLDATLMTTESFIVFKVSPLQVSEASQPGNVLVTASSKFLESPIPKVNI